jgi:hypothetical protein
MRKIERNAPNEWDFYLEYENLVYVRNRSITLNHFESSLENEDIGEGASVIRCVKVHAQKTAKPNR